MNSSHKIRVMLADDHDIARAGTTALLSTQSDLEVVGTAEDGAQAIAMWRQLLPDVLVVDLRMPVLDGVSVTTSVCAERPEARVLVLSHYDGEADIFRALKAGARGYLTKDTRGTALIDAIRILARGERYIPPAVAMRLAEHLNTPTLSPREHQVLCLLSDGLTNKAIAQAIGVGDRTVAQHVANLLAKLGARSRAEATSIGHQRGLLQRR